MSRRTERDRQRVRHAMVHTTTIGWALVAMACAAPISNRADSTPAPLVIQAQGSFAVGGTVVTAPGTFDPIAQGAYTPTPDPKGQTLHGDHAYVLYQCR